MVRVNLAFVNAFNFEKKEDFNSLTHFSEGITCAVSQMKIHEFFPAQVRFYNFLERGRWQRGH